MFPDVAIGDSIMSICDIIRWRAEHQPTDIAFVFLDDRGRNPQATSYGDLLSRVRAVAARIVAETARQEPVGCVFRPGPDFIVAFFACLWAGRIAVPVAPPGPRQDADELLAILSHSGARLVLTNEASLRAIETTPLGPSRAAICWRDISNWPGVNLPVHHDCSVSDSELAFLQYTSGSTGSPKGVMVGHDNLLDNSAQIARAFGHTSKSVGVIWLPPHHDMGLVGGIVQPIFVGFPVYLMAPADFIRSPVEWLRAISRYRATTSGGPAFAYEMCASRISEQRRAGLDLSCWEVAFCGAEPISIDTLRRFANAFEGNGFRKSALLPCYGMAEATLIVTCAARGAGATVSSLAAAGDDAFQFSGDYVDCGVPDPSTEVVVVDPETMRTVEHRQVGEIWVRGPSVAKGYWKDDMQTVGTFRARTPSSDHCFLRTGDLGFKSDNGFYICGRRKATAVLRGVNHSLEDIERTSASAHSALLGSMALAVVRVTDGVERLFVLQESASATREGSLREEVIGRIRERVVANHGVNPSGIALVPPGSLPRTRSGKLRRGDSETNWSIYLNHADNTAAPCFSAATA
jgi:acyl-CoA synthetase (AMP-forming)/AMP-acid ligase II